jgi:hypothetical protein
MGRLSNILQNNICNIHHSHDFQHEILSSFGIGSPTRLKSNLYVRTTPQGNSSHMFKKFPLWGSFSKDYNVYTIVFTIISTFYFFKDSYSHLIFLQVLIQLTTWSYWMQIMSPKALIFTPCILGRKKWMNNWPHSSTYIPHVSNQSSSATYNFPSFCG